MCWGQWPANIKTEVDKKGAAFKSMMMTLELVSLLLEPSMLRKLGFRDYLAEVLPEPLSSKLSLEVR